MEEFIKAQAEIKEKSEAKVVSQKMYKVVQQCYEAEMLRVIQGRFFLWKNDEGDDTIIDE